MIILLNEGTNYRFCPSEHSDPWHNLWDKVDIFILSHLLGYWCKVKAKDKLLIRYNFTHSQTLIFRDWWLTTVISVMFEFLEYSLEHQLPNFSECWSVCDCCYAVLACNCLYSIVSMLLSVLHWYMSLSIQRCTICFTLWKLLDKLYWRWDHWILDVLICNGGGTVLGIYTLRWIRHNILSIFLNRVSGGSDWKLTTGGDSTRFPLTGLGS